MTQDLIVVGAGFAGSACARNAAAHGLRTMILERNSWPARRVHTTGILVRELAEQWDPPARLTRRIENVRLYGPGGRSLDLHSPGYYFLATDTEALSEWHRRQAIDAGAALRFGCPFRNGREAGDVHLINDGDLRTRYLVGADGARSSVAAHFGMGRNRQFLFGVEAELPPLPELDPSALHVFIDGELAPGYIGWVVPGVNTTQIGVGSRLPSQLDLRAFMGRVETLLKLALPRHTAIRSGAIPCGGIVPDWHGPNLLLLGDAAGTVSPLTGGGIHPAVHLGGMAGQVIADHLLCRGPEPHLALAPHLPVYGIKLLLRAAFDHLPAKELLTRLLFSSLPFRALAHLVFFHQRGLLTTAAWRDLMELVQGT
ncbi:MAG: NAD(P)/FAD-dependent oxidoreductase [Gammaproteobacteria bacterium]|nr:NAD(P)/FAD-dependent oxidoreductase [Gammaproteobacteria bacterium]